MDLFSKVVNEDGTGLYSPGLGIFGKDSCFLGYGAILYLGLLFFIFLINIFSYMNFVKSRRNVYQIPIDRIENCGSETN